MKCIAAATGAALFCCAALAQTTPADAPLKLTFDDALARARQYSQQAYSANIASLMAHEDTLQAKNALKPAVNALSGYIYTQPNGTPSGVFVPNDGHNVYTDWVTAHGDIYNPAMRAAYGKTMAAEALAKAKNDLALRDLTTVVSEDYYAMVGGQRKIVNAEQSLREARDFLDLTEKQEHGGEAAHVDVIKAQIEVNHRARDLQDARAAFDKARITFAVILFPTYNQAFTVEDDLERARPLPAFPEVQSLASKNNPDIRAAEAALAQQNSAMKEARAGFLPSLSTDFFYGLQANQFAIHNHEGDTLIGASLAVNLNIPIFNWGINRSRVRQAEMQIDQAKRDLSLAQRTLLSEMDQFYLEAQVALSQIASLRESLELSRENLDKTRLRYTAGESSAQEVVDAQSTLVDSRGAVDDGLVRYRMALANLQTLTGVF
ncbi:MAG TPA: TolC family protein [Verrucomicrobiae bacterium]|nr:TolC family protein [Verrucomicrobiae bacterium]